MEYEMDSENIQGFRGIRVSANGAPFGGYWVSTLMIVGYCGYTGYL